MAVFPACAQLSLVAVEVPTLPRGDRTDDQPNNDDCGTDSHFVLPYGRVLSGRSGTLMPNLAKF